jgi:3-hydroxyisobutyrate dehydrogenase-like beta-hydroxyacid dehydrogenase
MSQKGASETAGSPRVGVVGLGEMGRAIVTRLALAGRPLTVYDVRPEAAAGLPPGTVVAAVPREVSAAADVVLVIVVDEAQVRDVLWGPEGLMKSARPELSIVVLSTIGVPALLDIAEKALQSGVSLIDCGVTGGDVAAERGVVSMVGGDDAMVERVRPVVDDYSSRVFHMGPLGAGMITKLVRNVITYATWHVVYQAGRLAEQSGVDLALVSDVIVSSHQGAGGLTFPWNRGTMEQMDPSDPDFDPAQFQRMTRTVALVHKDLAAAEALADQVGVDLSVAPPTRADASRIFGIEIAHPGQLSGTDQ